MRDILISIKNRSNRSGKRAKIGKVGGRFEICGGRNLGASPRLRRLSTVAFSRRGHDDRIGHQLAPRPRYMAENLVLRGIVAVRFVTEHFAIVDVRPAPAAFRAVGVVGPVAVGFPGEKVEVQAAVLADKAVDEYPSR
jgi:hypothetical protein